MRATAFLAAVLMLSACSSSRSTVDPLSGRTRTYQDGLPDFDLEVVADPSVGGLAVHLGIPGNSLTFLGDSRDAETIAEIAVEIRDEEQEVIHRFEAVDTIRTSRAGPSPILKAFSIPASGGRYWAEASVTDRATGSSAMRHQTIILDTSGVGTPHLLLDGDPLVSLTVNEAAGELSVRLPMDTAGEPKSLSWMFLRFPSDREPARPNSALDASLGSRAYRGVLYERPDTLQQETIEAWTTQIWSLPSLSAGVYGIEVNVEQHEPVRRVLIVRDAQFPSVNELSSLIDGLSYIATPDELGLMARARTPREMRAGFDAFWGNLLGDSRRAREVIARYYSRAEFANREYSAYKEGWRTDRGMVYMVMGPPLVIEPTPEGELWLYSYDQNDLSRRYEFKRVGGFDDGLHLSHHVLMRSPRLDREWRIAVERWRRGQVR